MTTNNIGKFITDVKDTKTAIVLHLRMGKRDIITNLAIALAFRQESDYPFPGLGGGMECNRLVFKTALSYLSKHGDDNIQGIAEDILGVFDERVIRTLER